MTGRGAFSLNLVFSQFTGIERKRQAQRKLWRDFRFQCSPRADSLLEGGAEQPVSGNPPRTYTDVSCDGSGGWNSSHGHEVSRLRPRRFGHPAIYERSVVRVRRADTPKAMNTGRGSSKPQGPAGQSSRLQPHVRVGQADIAAAEEDPVIRAAGERLRRMMEDQVLMIGLAAKNFEGKEWLAFEDVLIDYG